MRLLASILLVVKSIMFLVQPLGNTSSFDLREMYEQCSHEDADITPLDFVFEHLLNFELIIHYFEGEKEEEHQPLHSAGALIDISVVLPQAVSFAMHQHVVYYNSKTFVITDTNFHSSSFFADILRPPIA